MEDHAPVGTTATWDMPGLSAAQIWIYIQNNAKYPFF